VAEQAPYGEWGEGSLKQQLEVVNKTKMEFLRMMGIKDDELSPFSIEEFSSNLDDSDFSLLKTYKEYMRVKYGTEEVDMGNEEAGEDDGNAEDN
jgi:hypothetical protein